MQPLFTVIIDLQYKAILPSLGVLSTWALVEGHWVTFFHFCLETRIIYKLNLKAFASPGPVL